MRKTRECTRCGEKHRQSWNVCCRCYRIRRQEADPNYRKKETSRDRTARTPEESQERKRARRREWFAENPQKNAQYNLARKGKARDYMRAWHQCNTRAIKPSLVLVLRERQKGLCAICSVRMDTEEKRRAAGEQADHDHVANVPRGLLCMICNRALGFYEKHQKPAGLSIGPYDAYLANPPASSETPTVMR